MLWNFSPSFKHRLFVATRCVSTSPASSSQDGGLSHRSHKLELVASYPLHGVVESMAVLNSRPGSAQLDAVMLAFRWGASMQQLWAAQQLTPSCFGHKHTCACVANCTWDAVCYCLSQKTLLLPLPPARDAKLSVLQWDKGSHCLRTSSMHSFEREAGIREGRQVAPSQHTRHTSISLPPSAPPTHPHLKHCHHLHPRPQQANVAEHWWAQQPLCCFTPTGVP